MAKSKRNRAIGLIMDAGEMRVAEVSGTPQRFRMTAFGCAALKPGVLSEGIPADIPAAAAILSQLLKGNGFSSKTPVVIGAKNQNVLLRMASFPRVPADKMRSVVMYQAQQFIPIPISELILDYVECETSKYAEQQPMMDVLLVGARKVFLSAVLELCGKAGRTVADIDSAALATMRAVSDIHEDDGRPYLLADIDHETTGMMVCRGNTILMARTAVHPVRFDMLVSGHHENASLDEETLLELSGLLSDTIQASMQYFSTQDSTPINRIYLIGRFTQINDIAREIERRLEVPAILPQLYPTLSPADTLRYGTCISLALRGLEG